MFSLFKSKALYEVDSTLYLFLAGLGLGTLIFFSLKSIWVVFLYIVFLLSILFHDFVQIYIASLYDLRIKKYVLYPFGSRKMYGEDFSSPWHEVFYSLSGLLVYLIFFLSAVFLAKYLPSLWPGEIVLKTTLTEQTFDDLIIDYPLFSIFWINFLLFTFNLIIPASPFDGGRLLRSVLVMAFGHYSANSIIHYVSKVVSILIMGLGLLFWDLIIGAIGLFIYFASSRDIKENEILTILADKSVNDFVRSSELVFTGDITIAKCFDMMKKDLIPEGIVVLEQGRYGVVDAEKLSQESKSNWGYKTLGDVIDEVDPATEKEQLAYIAQYMVEKNLSILPVVHSRTRALIGIIKRSDLADFLKIHKIYG